MVTYLAFQVTLSFAVEVISESDIKLEGMSITGNHELPNSLNIVPWRSTEKLSGISAALPELTGHQKLQPINRAEFMREVEYFYWLNPEVETNAEIASKQMSSPE